MIYKAFLNRQEITGFPVKGKETSEIWGGNTLLWKKSGGIRKNIVDYAVFDKCTTTSGVTLVNLISGSYSNIFNPEQKFAIFVGGNSIIKVIDSFEGLGFAIAYKNSFYIIHTDENRQSVANFCKYSDKGELVFRYSNPDSIENMIFQGFYVGDDDTFYCIFYKNKGTSYYPVPEQELPPTVFGYKGGKRVYSAEIEQIYCKPESTDYISNQYKISEKAFIETNRFITPSYTYPFTQALLEIGTNKLALVSKENTFNSRRCLSYASLGGYKGSIYLTGNYAGMNYGSFVCKYDGNNCILVYSAWEDTSASLDWRNWAMRIETPCAFYANNMYFISSPDSRNSNYPYGVYKLDLATCETPKLIYGMDRNEKIKRMHGSSEISYTFLDAICLTIANGKLYVHKSFLIDSHSSPIYDRVYSMDEIPL